ncbi:hypothetical protein [Pseudomonas sp. LB3P58]|jgi:hypothetical protein
MTKISIASAPPSDDLEAAKFLHQRFKMSLMGSQKKLAMGDRGFFTHVIFTEMTMFSAKKTFAT